MDWTREIRNSELVKLPGNCKKWRVICFVFHRFFIPFLQLMVTGDPPMIIWNLNFYSCCDMLRVLLTNQCLALNCVFFRRKKNALFLRTATIESWGQAGQDGWPAQQTYIHHQNGSLTLSNFSKRDLIFLLQVSDPILILLLLLSTTQYLCFLTCHESCSQVVLGVSRKSEPFTTPSFYLK